VVPPRVDNLDVPRTGLCCPTSRGSLRRTVLRSKPQPLIPARYQEEVDLAQLPEDADVNVVLLQADTAGVPLFQGRLLTVANSSGAEAEELRRAVGMRRSWERMKNLEVRLRGAEGPEA
jgi:hypothetical protein